MRFFTQGSAGFYQKQDRAFGFPERKKRERSGFSFFLCTNVLFFIEITVIFFNRQERHGERRKEQIT